MMLKAGSMHLLDAETESPAQPFTVLQAHSAYGSLLPRSLQTAGVSQSSTVYIVTRDSLLSNDAILRFWV